MVFKLTTKNSLKLLASKYYNLQLVLRYFVFHDILCCVYLVAFSRETDVDQACSAHGLNNSAQC